MKQLINDFENPFNSQSILIWKSRADGWNQGTESGSV